MMQLNEQDLRRITKEAVTEAINATLMEVLNPRFEVIENELRTLGINQELMRDEIAVIHKYVKDIGPMNQDITVLKADMMEVKAELKVMKAVLIDHSNELDGHERRITQLEH